MKGIEIQPFADEHFEPAATLLAERHARHREAEPLLPADVDFRAELEKERDELPGVVALAGDEVVGYLLGTRKEDWIGPHVWSGIAGHAVREPELTRDLYAGAAGAWVEAGLTRHYVFAPALPELHDPWFRLSFGASAALAMRETGADFPESDVSVRGGQPDDLETAARLDRLMAESMMGAPSFSWREPEDEADALEEWREVWDEPETYPYFVAERDGEIVGHVVLYRRPPDLRVRPDSIDLAAASTVPGARGSGVGSVLTAHVLDWAAANGYPVMTIDWRMTNLLASRFWPRRGFRETFLRLYRAIP